MIAGSRPSGWPDRCRRDLTVLALLFASCVSAACATPNRPPCVEQNNDVLREIASGVLDAYAPATAAWEREQARACGWILPEDMRE